MSKAMQRILATLVIAAVVGVGAWTFTHLEVTTDITHFLPESEDHELARISQQMTSSDLSRSVTLLVHADDEATTLAASRDLVARLEGLDEVEWVKSGPGEDLNEAFYELYFERRLLFFTDTPEAAALSDDDLAEAGRELRRRLVSQTGAFVRRIAQRDPLLAFPRHLERLQDAQQGSLRVVDGQLLTEDGRAVVFLATRESPFDAAAAHRLADGIDAALAAVRAAHGSSVTIDRSGFYRFTIASEQSIRSDVVRISVVSTIGVILLFVLVFRSPRYLLLGSIALGAGLVAGLTVTQLSFGRIHGMSLAFGATLIGVAIDYVAHAVNHHTLEPHPGGPWKSVAVVWPGLALGAATTVAGLIGLAWTSIPGIRELAVLTSTGVIVALLVTRYLLPVFMPERPVATSGHRWLRDRLGEQLARLRGSRAALIAMPALSLALCVVGLWRLSWVDDVSVLATFDDALRDEDERVRQAVSRMDTGRFVIAWGHDEEQALQRNDEVFQRLTAAQAAGELTAFRSLHSLLWSARSQRASFDALREADAYARLDRAFEAEGYVAGSFAAFGDDLRADPPAPLTFEELSSSPLGSLVSSFRVDLGEGRVAFVTLTRDADIDAVEARLAGLEGVRLFDQQSFMQSAYGRFRTRTLEMIGFGLFGVFLIVLVRYRRLGLALAAFLPAVLAAATALAVVVLAGYEVNLLHVVGLILVLSMGVDYGVFMVESRADEHGPAATMVSLLLACVSTVLSFGLLAMSTNPALRALGLIAGIGVLLSLLLAPMAWLLLGGRPGAPPE
ncbi:MAG: MMPL family transporter [Sandaracinaceae bacterium]|nr:MMPL family transporter [Sandaracinaceae bacterium]